MSSNRVLTASQGQRIVSLVLCLFTILVHAKKPRSPSFKDVTRASGIIQRGRSFKFGGPCVADIDNDGNYDLLLTYHAGDPMQIFFGSRNGKFTAADFTLDTDIHGVSVAQHTAISRERIMSVAVGGGRGRKLRPPTLFMVSPDRSIKNITRRLGFGKIGSRGRVSMFMDLSMKAPQRRMENKGGPDVLFVNFLGHRRAHLRQFAYENVRGRNKLRDVKGFSNEREGRAEVTDIDGDGIMELISFRNFRIYELVKPFEFVENTRKYIPYNVNFGFQSVSSVSEFDMDNDGDFDLYISRTNASLISKRNLPYDDDISDVLLENRNGMYVDISKKAGIPKRTNSMGVTNGDFNNDGYVDLMISLWDTPDMILLNQGDGTFKRVDGLIPKPSDSVGDHAVAVDYNMDGRVDLVVGQGTQTGITGMYLLLQNTLRLNGKRHYLLVHVANEPDRGATSLHAVVTVQIGSMRMTRRVGSPGAQAGGGSYLDTVHFGLGLHQKVDSVTVRWSNMVVRRMRNVAADQKVVFGVI